MFEQMLKEKYDVTIFFYNPNIHPKKEYEPSKIKAQVPTLQRQEKREYCLYF